MRRGIAFLLTLGACFSVPAFSHADDVLPDLGIKPGVWIIDFGGYGVFEPTYEGSKKYNLSYKPQVDFYDLGDREWLSFPNDAFDYALYETANFRAGPAANISLQSRYHGEDIDFSLGKADATLQGGVFAEYYPVETIRTRIEVLQGVTGNTGLVANLSADYIWRPAHDWMLTIGPRAQLANDQYASDYFSTQLSIKYNSFVPYKAEGGIISSGAEVTGKYDLTKQFSAKFFIDYNQLMGDAADSPRVNIRGTAEQVIVGVGASYKFAIEH
jgi:outer membrane protein